MSFSKRACFLVLWLSSANLVFCVLSDGITGGPVKCILDSKCSCTMSDNSGRYDLSKLSGSPTPYFEIVGRNSSEKFYYDPCVPFSIPDAVSGQETACEYVAVCQTETSTAERKTRYFNIAKHITTDFIYHPPTQQMTVHYTNDDVFHPFTTEVQLRCTPNSDTYNLQYLRLTDSAASFSLSSRYACLVKPDKAGLSFGSVLCILFSLSFIVYFVGGALVLVFIQHKPLSESIPPNKDFWLELPDLILDGARFAMNGFKVSHVAHQRLDRVDDDDHHPYHDDLNDEEELESKPQPSAGPPESSDGFTAVPV
ncbi:uncharacterized protein LOC119734440 [Patiria miniata]|uniref:Autophagy-related protein 27 n=1 Tax=Patiria miniata TaxID=46514 RepID=A0A914AJG9_PATMI|nr:uncharacterized protein LOC119734440 [Patiria miniata]